MAKVKDLFSQFFYMSVTQSAANTLTFAKLGIGVSLFDYAGLLIQRIEYTFARAGLQAVVAQADELASAITGSDSLNSLTGDKPEVYDKVVINAVVDGTPATLLQNTAPVVHDFTSLQGGGLLVPAQDIYIACESAGLAAAAVVEARVYYTVRELVATDYLELVQRLRVLST